MGLCKMLAIQFLLFLSISLLTEAKKPGGKPVGKPKYCKNPKGKNGESKCLNGEWMKCNKKKWISTGKPCYSPYTLIETDSTSDPLTLQSTNCTSSNNLLTSLSPVNDEKSCDQQCVQYGSSCGWWSFNKIKSKCDLLLNCNVPISELHVTSGQQGTISSYHFQVSKGGNQFLIKDCLLFNTTCILPNKTNVIDTIQINLPVPGTIEQWNNFNPVQICGNLCLGQTKPICNAFTLDTIGGLQCNLLTECSHPTTAIGSTSGDRFCPTYRKNYGIEEGICTSGYCCLPPYTGKNCCPPWNLNCCDVPNCIEPDCCCPLCGG